MDSHFHAVAAASIRELRTERTEHVATGAGIKDYGEYREAVGYIRGLDDALKLLAEADEDILKG